MSTATDRSISLIAACSAISTSNFSKGTGVYYIPNFVTDAEEGYLIQKIQNSPHKSWRQLRNRRLQLWGGEITQKNVLLASDLPSIVTSYPDLITRLKDTGAFDGSPHGQPNHIILNEYLPGQGIMPHEDGPAYHPVVATLSLGTHTVFHYYRYAPNADEKPSNAPENDQPSSTEVHGRRVDPTPVLTILLEPRSLVITTDALYGSHLHGICDVKEDSFILTSSGRPHLRNSNVELDNWHLLADEEIKGVIEKGEALPRGIRYSLTCRDVAHVLRTGKLLGAKR